MREEAKILHPHVAINVRNIGQGTEGYRKMLKLEPSRVLTGYAKFDIQNPPRNLT